MTSGEERTHGHCGTPGALDALVALAAATVPCVNASRQRCSCMAVMTAMIGLDLVSGAAVAYSALLQEGKESGLSANQVHDGLNHLEDRGIILRTRKGSMLRSRSLTAAVNPRN